MIADDEVWRIERNIPQNVCKGDMPACMAQSPELAAEIVAGMNLRTEVVAALEPAVKWAAQSSTCMIHPYYFVKLAALHARLTSEAPASPSIAVQGTVDHPTIYRTPEGKLFAGNSAKADHSVFAPHPSHKPDCAILAGITRAYGCTCGLYPRRKPEAPPASQTATVIVGHPSAALTSAGIPPGSFVGSSYTCPGPYCPCEKCRSQADPDAPSAQSTWLIYFEDADVPIEVFTTEAEARTRYAALRDNWACHLFASVDEAAPAYPKE